MRNEFHLPAWPDQAHWDQVYAEINAADTRTPHFKAAGRSQILTPLTPLRRNTRIAPENAWATMLSTLQNAGEPPAKESAAPTSESEQPKIVTTVAPADTTPLAQATSPEETPNGAQQVSNETSQSPPAIPEKITLIPPRQSDSNICAIPSCTVFGLTSIQLMAEHLKAEHTGTQSNLSAQITVLPTEQNAQATTPSTLVSNATPLPFASKQQQCVNNDFAVQRACFSDEIDTRQRLNTSERMQNLLIEQLAGEDITPSRRRALELGQKLLTCNLESIGNKAEPNAAFWDHQLSAIQTLLNANDDSTAISFGRDAMVSLEHLRQAETELESYANLKIGNANFCYEVTGFGQYRTWDSNVFAPGQQLLLYCELENHTTKETEQKGVSEYVTKLKNSIVICDANNRVVQQIDFPMVEDHARSRRRDFYLFVPIVVGQLPHGSYRAYLSINDMVGNKTTTLDPPIQFEVK